MEEQMNNGEKKQGLSKRVIAIIAVLLVVLIGGATAYIALNSSEKTKYFAAEKATLDFIGDEFEGRFKPELKWQEYTQKNAIANTIELSGQYNDPYGAGANDPFSPDQILNNSSLTFNTEQDIDNKKMSAEVIASVAGMEIDGINVYITDDKFMLGLPFLDDVLLVENDDINKLLSEIDPELDEIDFELSDLFEPENQFLSEEDIEYFEKEYVEMIFKDLPDDAFTSKNEKTDVEGKSIKAEKLTMHLNEKKLKDILVKVLDKMSKDEKIKEIIKDQLSTTAVVDQDMNEIFNEFEEGLKMMKDEVQDLYIPDGLTSHIWVENKLVVKRELTFTIGSSEDDAATININGEQLLNNKNQTFTYDFGYTDAYDEGDVTIIGDLSWKDDKIEDSIKLIVDDIEISYEANETVDKDKRDFNRVFSYSDSIENGSIIWAGEASYEKDSMSSVHDVSLDIDELGEDFLSIHLAIDGKKIKDVDIPDGDSAKNIGQMSEIELYEYIESDVAMQFQQWLMQLLGGGAMGF